MLSSRNAWISSTEWASLDFAKANCPSTGTKCSSRSCLLAARSLRSRVCAGKINVSDKACNQRGGYRQLTSPFR